MHSSGRSSAGAFGPSPAQAVLTVHSDSLLCSLFRVFAAAWIGLEQHKTCHAGRFAVKAAESKDGGSTGVHEERDR